jgi:hypothetical protein
MHPLTQTLLTVAIVAAAIAAYHMVSTDEPGADAGAPVALYDGAISALERRMARIEEDRPVRLHAAGLADLGERLDRIEARLSAVEVRGPEERPRTATAEDAPPAMQPAVDGAVTGASTTAPLTEAQERRVRDLANRVLQSREQRRMAGLLDGALNRLDLDLTDGQRKKVEEALSAHHESVRQTLDKARVEGLSFEAARERLVPLEERFRETLSSLVPAADADELVRVLTAPPGPPPGAGGPPPGRRPPAPAD